MFLPLPARPGRRPLHHRAERTGELVSGSKDYRPWHHLKNPRIFRENIVLNWWFTVRFRLRKESSEPRVKSLNCRGTTKESNTSQNSTKPAKNERLQGRFWVLNFTFFML